MIVEQKGTRMAEDGEDWNGLKMTILKSLAISMESLGQYFSTPNRILVIYSGIPRTFKHETRIGSRNRGETEIFD